MPDDPRNPSEMHYEESFCVRSYEIDAATRARVRTLTNYLQEVAGRHAALLGASLEHLQSENRTWMLVRLHLEMVAWPRWRDRICIETWPSGAESVVATRDFEIYDAAGEKIGVATSAWMVVDMRRRRAVRLPQAILDLPRCRRSRALVDEFRKLPAIDTPDLALHFELRRSEVDLNLHANQSAYVDWAVNAVPEMTWRTRHLTGLEIAFLAEARQDDRVRSEMQDAGEGVFLHRLVRERDGRELARMRTRWEDGTPG